MKKETNIVLNHIHLSHAAAPPALNPLLCCFRRDTCRASAGRRQHRSLLCMCLISAPHSISGNVFQGSESETLNYVCFGGVNDSRYSKDIYALKVQERRQSAMESILAAVFQERHQRDRRRSSHGVSDSLQVSDVIIGCIIFSQCDGRFLYIACLL